MGLYLKNKMNQKEANEKILEIMNNRNLLSQEEIELFKELIFKCDLKIQDKYEFTPLLYALKFNKSQNLNLTVEQWDYLIKQSDLKIKDKNEYTQLMYVLICNKDQDLNLREDQWDYLIKNSDLNQQNKYGYTPLMYALYFNKTDNLNLTTKQIQTMYHALDEDQQQTIFKNIIYENKNNNPNNNQYLEEINLLLYDFQFKPNKKIISWLQKNKYQDIIQMIEKRDLFFQLNQEVKEIDNHQKIAIIKL